MTPATGGPEVGSGTGLRARAMRGGAYVTVRQVAGSAIRFLGIVVLTRLIGPDGYGGYAGALAIVMVLTGVGSLGIDAFLIRSEDEPAREVEAQAATLLLLAGAGIAVGAAVLVPVLSGRAFDDDFAAPMLALLAFVPLTALRLPATARLERAFRYRAVTMVELGADLGSYALAIPLAVAGAGVWAPVAGALVGQVWATAASLRLARFRPTWHWSRPLASDVLGYGLGYAASTWVFQLVPLVNPLVVGRYAGPTGVAYVALTGRLVDTLAIVKRATSRLAMVALARVQRDAERLRSAQAEGMVLQLLGVGPVLALFSVLAPWLVPVLFGDGWSPVLDLYPLFALNALCGTLFNLHSAALQVLRRNRPVVKLRVAQVAVLAGASLLLVPHIGVVGFGVGEALRAPTFVVLHLQVRRLYRPQYRDAVPWLIAFGPALFAAWLPFGWGLLLLLPTAAVLATPSARAVLAGHARLTLGSLRRRARSGSVAPA